MAMTVDDLCDTERLVLRSFRSWLSGLLASDGRCLEWAWRNLAAELGQADATAVLTEICRLLFRIAGTSRRSIAHHPPCCPWVGADEWHLLYLLSACQHGRQDSAVWAAHRLTGSGAAEEVIDSAFDCSHRLKTAGRILPDRTGALAPVGLGLHQTSFSRH
jgi:hypothetical protein